MPHFEPFQRCTFISCYLSPCLIGSGTRACVIDPSRAFRTVASALLGSALQECSYFALGSAHRRSTLPDLIPSSFHYIVMPALAQDKVMARDLKAKKTKSRNGCGRCKLKRVWFRPLHILCKHQLTTHSSNAMKLPPAVCNARRGTLLVLAMRRHSSGQPSMRCSLPHKPNRQLQGPSQHPRPLPDPRHRLLSRTR